MRPRSAVFPLLGLLLTGCAGVGGHVRPGATEAATACASPAPTPATSPSSGPTLAPNALAFNFDDPWGLVAMFMASQRTAVASAILVSPKLAIALP